ncbi:hypothetical protein CEP52_014720 [Fusarium oligoseptatum]|uniref:Uncharacterized protein n=2 Tax=Fusarium solani species complex TaxID=232080 RepID=A0A428SJM0_9HYPO|nr:hypothetical protein CEP52_014720 [Fusarium oligoseptatum]
MDDTLDWTAFQMAILGGAGDLLQDMSNEEDQKQVEEITSWFESFGFETYGTLVPEDVPSMRSSSRSTVSSTPSTIDTDIIDLPIPQHNDRAQAMGRRRSPQAPFVVAQLGGKLTTEPDDAARGSYGRWRRRYYHHHYDGDGTDGI